MGKSCCGNGIDTSALQERQRRVLRQVLVINIATFLMMVAASVISGSSALLSGTLDNLGDAITYAISLAVVGASPLAKARVAFFKGLLILSAAIGVGVHIVWGLLDPGTPIAETMGIAAVLNLGANMLCLRLLTPHRDEDVNMSSVWECSRNDVIEGTAVIAAAVAVWFFQSGWPDVLIATALLILFLRSALRVLAGSWAEMRAAREQASGSEQAL